MQEKIIETLHNTFHFNSFRPGQLEAITTLMNHGRLLCIQPTGHGKSLLYQLPSVLLEGLTLVISPLLALMRDQLSQLKNRFGIAAASINTDQTEEENFAARQLAMTGKIRILFIAPEQLDNLVQFDFLLKLPIQLLVVDEAHCISSWGHDFRPSYRQIIQLVTSLRESFPDLKLLALTATANKKTEMDIQQQLNDQNKKMIVHRETMNRPNIRLTIVPASHTAEKLAHLTHLLSILDGSGLIYCATRENTEIVAEYLSTQGILTTAYHAGIESRLKKDIQQDFIQDKFKVISATNALGMGIDKSNLRYIIHFDFPGSITAYYQEVGRAGRDGLPADGILLYDPKDKKIQNYFIESAEPSPTDFQLILNTLTSSQMPPTLNNLKRLTGLHPTRLNVIMAELIEQNFLKKIRENGAQVYKRTPKTGFPDLMRYKIQNEVKNAELKRIQHFAEQTHQCLMVILREALGDTQTQLCGKCSICQEAFFHYQHSKDLLITITSWLEKRIVPITLSKKISKITSGIAVLDGKLRSPLFIQFMRERMLTGSSLPEELLQLIRSCLKDLSQHYPFGSLISLPSRTWGARETVMNVFASWLKIPVFNHLLTWKELPAARQGELLNNDQRQHNVTSRMHREKNIKIPKGTILLIDDYIGSGATLNEAARSLRDASIDNEIVPFTIASVKWRLGSKGMI